MATPSRSTVLIVTPSHTRSLLVSNWLLRWGHALLWALSVATAVLALALAVTGWQYWSDHQEQRQTVRALQQQVAALENFTSAEIEAKLAALKKSEQVVADVQAYLKQRGVHVQPVSAAPSPGQPNPAAGGPVMATRPVPYTGSFASDAGSLLAAIQTMPLGVPHPGALTSRFGNRPNPFTGRGGEYHPGLDFRGATGDEVQATADGKVLLASYHNGYGNMVQVRHGHGYTTLYGHLSRIMVEPGQTVHAGEVIGLVGSTGRSTGPHLHYEVQRLGERQDPESYLSLQPLQ